jgi:hypothetical protein
VRPLPAGCRRLFLGNIGYGTSAQDLEAHLARVVEPVAVWVTPATDQRRHRGGRESRGFGFADIRAEEL